MELGEESVQVYVGTCKPWRLGVAGLAGAVGDLLAEAGFF
jgi:hypothetical protein